MKQRMILIGFILLCITFAFSKDLVAQIGDDFENTSIIYTVNNSTGGALSATNDAVQVHQGSSSLHINYTLNNPGGWLFVRRAFPGNQNWQTKKMVSFWLKGDGSDNKLNFKFTANGTEHRHPNGETISLKNTSWQYIEIPLGDFYNSIPSEANLALVANFLIGIAGTTDTNVNYDVHIDDLQIVDPRPQLLSFDNVNTEIHFPWKAQMLFTNTTSVFQEGTGALKIDYTNITGWDFDRISIYTQDWSTNGGISFYLRGDGSTTAVLLFRIVANGGEFQTASIPLTDTFWRKIVLRFSDIKTNGVGRTITASDLQKVTKIDFVLNGGNPDTGYLYLDDLRLIPQLDQFTIDDFESYFATYSIYGTGTIVATNSASDAHAGAQSLKLDYDLSGGTWAGVRHNFSPTNNFTIGGGVSFWVRGDGSTNDFKIQLGTTDVTTPVGGYYWRAFIPLNDTSWHRVWVPFSEFMDATGQRPSQTGLTSVSNYWFFVTGGGSGTVYVDDLTIYTTNASSTPLEWILSKQSGVSYLIDSYDDLKNSGWIYDQALAAISLVSKGSNERARWLLKTLQYRQEGNGSYVTVYDPYTGKPDNSTWHYTGNNAWVIMAVNYYTYKTGDSQFLTMASKCADRLLIYQHADGAFSMGPEGPLPTRYSTENNFDCFSAFYYLAKLTGNATYSTAAQNVLKWLQITAWDNTLGYFWEGKEDNWKAL
ncbi:MAG: hypothetical protein KKH98_01215, partial [Spirochaetes bacterium]|nr:hypothetical protein [Spirochaetota bacterium]